MRNCMEIKEASTATSYDATSAKTSTSSPNPSIENVDTANGSEEIDEMVNSLSASLLIQNMFLMFLMFRQ